jgi:hypothetical protein
MAHRRTADDFRADSEGKSKAKATDAVVTTLSVSDAVSEINQLLIHADLTRLDAGRKLLALRARV